MEAILQDWKFWGMVIQSAIMIGGFCLIKFNDFRHLTLDVEEIKSKIDSLDKKVVNLRTDVAVLQEKTKKL